MTAIGYEHDFPFTPEHKALLAGHIRQRSELHAFFAAINRGVGLKATNYIVGSWVCFFEGLRAGRYSADLTAST